MLGFSRWSASLVFVLLCVPSPSQAFTLKRTSSGEQIRWYKQRITLRIDPRVEDMLPPGEARAAALMASEAWRGLPDVPDIVIADGAPPARDPARRNNAVYLLEHWPYDPSYLALTVITYRPNGEIIGVDVLLNPNKSFAALPEGEHDGSTAQHDLASVLTHEFGHVLGLDESYDDEMATMWPYIRAGEVHQRSLAEDDENGVIETYRGGIDAAACSAAAAVGGRSAHPRRVPGLMLGGCLGAMLLARRPRTRIQRREAARPRAPHAPRAA